MASSGRPNNTFACTSILVSKRFNRVTHPNLTRNNHPTSFRLIILLPSSHQHKHSCDLYFLLPFLLPHPCSNSFRGYHPKSNHTYAPHSPLPYPKHTHAKDGLVWDSPPAAAWPGPWPSSDRPPLPLSPWSTSMCLSQHYLVATFCKVGWKCFCTLSTAFRKV